jgi:hypothetical protein
MKNNKIKSLVVLFTALMFTSCVNDLNVTPKDPNIITSLTVYSTPAAYKEGLAKLYATFAVSGQQGPAGQPDIAGIDEGFSNYLRQYWNAQELSTDEAVMAWNDASIKDFHWQTWAPNDVFIAAIYSRIMYTVALCNEYIRATTGNTDADIMNTMLKQDFFVHWLIHMPSICLEIHPLLPKRMLQAPFSRSRQRAGSYLHTSKLS